MRVILEKCLPVDDKTTSRDLAIIESVAQFTKVGTANKTKPRYLVSAKVGNCRVTIVNHIRFWLLTVLFVWSSAYLWRSAVSPKEGDPKGCFDRALRIFGAVLTAAIAIYFIVYGLRLYGLISK
jgi:hypothetical protein